MRYRDGGYSRELPPADVKPATPKMATLAPVSGTVILRETLSAEPPKPWSASRGEWTAKDGGIWGMQKGKEQQGANLRVPLAITDGTIDFEVNFNGANRISVRVETQDRKGSFRVEISRTTLGITKNPSQGEGKDAVEPLARKTAKLESNTWYPVRISFKGTEATAQVNDLTVKASHAILGEPKTGVNFLVFGESAGLRNVTVAK